VNLAGIQTERHFENFCEVVDRTDLLADPRFATAAARLLHARECIAVLDEIFAARDLADWVKALDGLSTPWTAVQTAAETALDRQVVANRYVVDVAGATRTHPMVASPVQFDNGAPSLRRAPDHGEHTEEVLLELGRTWDDITELKARGAVR
jgi:crotonobetainyl-CoA:carnitine CoA-transferase CaiB-like acyl-CoA transferase